MLHAQRLGLLLAMLGLVGWGGGGIVHAGSILISFDTDPFDQAITAPSNFNQSTALTDLYAPLGVHFTGPGGPDGGAILNAGAAPSPPEDGSTGGSPVPDFGVFARSGTNVLAFNRDASLPGDTESNGGVPRDPETITFDMPVTSVSIYAAGGFVASTFTMDGYDLRGNLLGSTTLTTQDWGQLSLSSSNPFQSVVLSETSTTGDLGNGFLYDDLQIVTVVPEPASLALLGIGTLGIAGYLGLLDRKARRPSLTANPGKTQRIDPKWSCRHDPESLRSKRFGQTLNS
jgi:hypothetical protein